MVPKCIFLFHCLLLAAAVKATDPSVEQGKMIFMSRCASCHNINKTLIGPALAGVDERRTEDWIVNFVHSSQTMVKKGDKDAIALFEQFKIPMPDHPDLTTENIKSIVEFIKTESTPSSEGKASVVSPATKKPGYFPVFITSNFWPLLALMASVVFLIGTILFAVKINSMKKQAEKNKLRMR